MSRAVTVLSLVVVPAWFLACAHDDGATSPMSGDSHQPNGTSRPGAPLCLPPLDGVEAWLHESQDPVARFAVASRLGGVGNSELVQLEAAALRSPPISAATSTQHEDGSWGESEPAQRRILPTLATAYCLAQLGLTDNDHWSSAVEFLRTSAHTDGGVFSTDGRRAGVLSCYVGIAATTYLAGGRTDLAGPQIEWTLRYQDVRRSGRRLRATAPSHWNDHLAHRYGGCMSDTTCLIGLVKTGHALQAWRTEHPNDEVDDLVSTIRNVFLDRHLFLASDRSVLPLGVQPSNAQQWLEPTFPLDWHPDLIEVLDLVARTGPADDRLLPALDVLSDAQLPDHTWPLRRVLRPEPVGILERRSTKHGSRFVTARVLVALRNLA